MNQQSCGEQRRAYVVDDDERFRDSLLFLLSAAGWSGQGFASVADFLRDAAQLAPGILLLDIRMPGMNGLELLESTETATRNFAIIVVTGKVKADHNGWFGPQCFCGRETKPGAALRGAHGVGTGPRPE